MSSARSTVPMWLDAPTVSTHGALPGAVMPPYCVAPCGLRPLLPAAATTTIPASHRALRGERQRIGVVRLVDARRDRQVDDADVQRVLVGDDVVERGDDVADAAAARLRRAP